MNTIAISGLVLIVAGVAWILVVGLSSGDLTARGGGLATTGAGADPNPGFWPGFWAFITLVFKSFLKPRFRRYLPGVLMILLGVVLDIGSVFVGNGTGGGGGAPASPSPAPPTSS